VQKYVPGYRLVNGPIFDGHGLGLHGGGGLGDYLPLRRQPGHHDRRRRRTAEMFAEEILGGRISSTVAEAAPN
jgi:acetaldehyde/propanal dehydrogenase